MQRKQFLRYLGASLGAAALAPVLTACGGGDDEWFNPVGVLTTAEIDALKFMREEEKLAYDVYVKLYDLWGASVFLLISVSERLHTEAILALLDKYGIPDPAEGKAPGVFEDPALQALYNTLIVMGQVSLIEALKVGCLIEETDIHDINEKKAITNELDILIVYDSLLCGSRNHLRSFNDDLLSRGVTYLPTVISQAEWDAIATAPMETCGI